MQRLVATPHNALSVRKRLLLRNPDSSYTAARNYSRFRIHASENDLAWIGALRSLCCGLAGNGGGTECIFKRGRNCFIKTRLSKDSASPCVAVPSLKQSPNDHCQINVTCSGIQFSWICSHTDHNASVVHYLASHLFPSFFSKASHITFLSRFFSYFKIIFQRGPPIRLVLGLDIWQYLALWRSSPI